MKKIAVLATAALIILGSASCKPKQSAYRQAYEQAKQREVAGAEDGETTATTATPMEVSKAVDREVVVRQERITPMEGERADNLQRFSVVIGSFQNQANAVSLKERMAAEGYSPVLVKNEQGMMRVIVTSFSTRDEAASSRDAIKSRFAPNFQDAWLLERAN